MKHAAVYDQDDDPDEPGEPTPREDARNGTASTLADVVTPAPSPLTITFDDEAHAYFIEYLLDLTARRLAVVIDSGSTGPGVDCQLLGLAADDPNLIAARLWDETADDWAGETIGIAIRGDDGTIDVTRVHVL